MLKAAVPSPTATSTRPARPELRNAAQDSLKDGRGRSGRVAAGLRGSCFHRAITFRTMVATAHPWTSWIRRNWVKSASSAPNSRALTTMPASSMT